MQGPSLHVAVIGAGINGVCTALALLDAGARVTLIDPGPPGGAQSASFGNGAFISPNSIIPMSMPGLWRKVPGYLLDREGPLTIDWRSLPRLAPWLIRFLLAGFTEAKVRKTAATLNQLLHDGPERHAALAERIGRPDLIRREGLLYVYPTRQDFEAEALSWQLRRENGVVWQELARPALEAREPGLGPDYHFGALVASGAHCTDPGAYVAALSDHACASGADLRVAKATGLKLEAGRLRGVATESGLIPCDRAVITAGIGSGLIARQAGDRIPMEAERGYHVQLTGADSEGLLRHPVMPSDGKMANTPLASGLRASGQVELSSTDAPPNWRRADILLRHLRHTWPGLPAQVSVTRWQGCRPSTPDGLPVIGPSRQSGDVFHAFGHGHVGLSAAPKTAAIVTALLLGQTPPIDAAPFAADRF